MPVSSSRCSIHVNGMASAESGCLQCHGAKVGLKTKDGKTITVDDLDCPATTLTLGLLLLAIMAAGIISLLRL